MGDPFQMRSAPIVRGRTNVWKVNPEVVGDSLGGPAPGDGLRVRHELLAVSPRMAEGRSLGGSPQGPARPVASRRATGPFDGHCGQFPCPSRRGGENTGPSPVDRRKSGSKHHLITDAHAVQHRHVIRLQRYGCLSSVPASTSYRILKRLARKMWLWAAKRRTMLPSWCSFDLYQHVLLVRSQSVRLCDRGTAEALGDHGCRHRARSRWTGPFAFPEARRWA